MAKLYFRYGVMGSSKSANALMVRYNYEERGQQALMVKPDIDQREKTSVVNSRIGLTWPCIWFSDLMAMTPAEITAYQCVIVDEAQFLSREEVCFLTDVVDEWNVPVICYGLRADFKGDLFPGSEALLAWADIIEEVKTICWCGKKATCNARFDKSGVVLKQGEQVVLGANDQYVGLCRRHWKEGNLGPAQLSGHALGAEQQSQDQPFPEAVLPVAGDGVVLEGLRPSGRVGQTDPGGVQSVDNWRHSKHLTTRS